MKTIIAPTDFSAAATNAVNYAADMAAAIDARLILLNVVQAPVTVSDIPLPEPVFEDMLRIGRSDLDELSKNLRIRTKGKVDSSTEIMVGDAGYQIKELAGQEKPFAIVMGIKAGKPTARFFMGSASLSSIRHLPYPVLIVPETFSFKGINKIGLATDLEDVTELPFSTLTEWLSVFPAKLDIIHIGKQGQGASPSDVGESVALNNHLHKFHPEFHFLTHEELAEGLNSFSIKHNLDLLIIVPKKHGLSELFNEKHAKKIVVHQQIPVLAIHQ